MPLTPGRSPGLPHLGTPSARAPGGRSCQATGFSRVQSPARGSELGTFPECSPRTPSRGTAWGGGKPRGGSCDGARHCSRTWSRSPREAAALFPERRGSGPPAFQVCALRAGEGRGATAKALADGKARSSASRALPLLIGQREATVCRDSGRGVVVAATEIVVEVLVVTVETEEMAVEKLEAADGFTPLPCAASVSPSSVRPFIKHLRCSWCVAGAPTQALRTVTRGGGAELSGEKPSSQTAQKAPGGSDRSWSAALRLEVTPGQLCPQHAPRPRAADLWARRPEAALGHRPFWSTCVWPVAWTRWGLVSI